MKRRHEKGEGGTPKVPRTSQGVKNDPRPWPLKAGMIMEVTLKNFMCHEKFKFEPNQRLNFLCGENGSGKSAVLTAIVFGLGGTARMSNRGSSNKGFIRTGQNSAVVEIKLCNQGETKYKPDLYGESITVMRTVTNSSSSYKLKDQHGRVVVEKKVKEELDNILTHFSIQVENPIIVLNQDASKTFLSKSDPDKMYQFFHRSTQLKDCEDFYQAAEVDKEEAEISLEKKLESLPELQRENDKWTKKWEFIQNLQSRHDEVKNKKKELAWGLYRDKKIMVEESSKVVEKEKKKIELAEKAIEGINKRDKEMRARKRDVEKEIQDIAKDYDPESKTLVDLKKRHDETKRQVQIAERVVTEHDRKMKKCKKTLDSITQEIKKHKSGKCREYEEKRIARQNQMQELQLETEALEAQIETSGNHLEHLKSDKRDADSLQSNARFEYTSKNTKIASLKRDMHELESGEKNKLTTFGAYMPRLCAEIDRCTKFGKKPIGPIGAHITLKDNVTDQISTVLEGEIGGLMLAFCVNSTKDQVILYNIFEKMNLPRKPAIITSEFSSERYDISRARVSSPKYTTLIDCIDTTEPTVFNTLVDMVKLEKIIIIDSAVEAQAILKNIETVPKNLMYAVVNAKHQYIPAPNYKSYYKEYRNQHLLKSSIEEVIALKKVQIAEEEREIALVQKEMIAQQTRVKEAMKLIEAEDRKIKAIRQKILQKNTKMESLNAEEFAEQPPDIAALEDDKDKFAAELETLENGIQEKKEKLETEVEIETAAKAAKEELEKALNEKMDMIDPLKLRLTECEDAIRKSKRDVDHYIGKKEEYRRKMKGLEDEYNAKVAESETFLERAFTFGPERMEVKKSIDTLKEEILKMEGKLQKLKENTEPVEVVKSNYKKYRKACDTAKRELKDLQQLISALGKAILLRKKGYKMILRATSQAVQRSFTTQLDVRKFVGRLKINHIEKTLEVKVNPNESSTAGGMNIDRDLKSLSGGERSFTLVSFILALWNAMNPPFRILDEFDVFMDAVNRRISVQNIINYAREDRRNQFMFLTPLDTNNIEINSDVKIIKLQKLKS